MEEKDILLSTIQALNVTISSLSKTNESLTKSNESQSKTIATLELRIKELSAQIAYLNRQLFGRKSEKLQPINPLQLDLFADLLPENAAEIEQAHDEAVGKITKEVVADKKQARRNRTMTESLPVLKRDIIDVEGIDLTRYRKIGEEVTKVVEHEPGKLYVREIVRIKYGLIDPTEPVETGVGVIMAPMVQLPIYKGVAGASLLAEILLQKYEYHMPFYRQIKQFEHLGIKGLTESTVDGWYKQVMILLKPLYDAIIKEVFKSDYCQADETTTPVVDKAKHKASREYLWMVRAVMEKLVFFHYAHGSRAGAVIEALTDRHYFRGYMQCDGFAGYESAYKTSKSVTLVNCMAHMRRKFEYALNSNKELSEHALTEIQHLYQIERVCDEAGLTPDERKAKRQELAKPIMDAMEVWLEQIAVKYGDKTPIGNAASYAYVRWANMRNYLEDGRIKLDNNLAENEIRPITLGRKNYLFCGNHEAAENMCIITSLLSTCRNHGVNPREYLNDIIARMPYMSEATHDELVELLPHKWKPQSVTPDETDKTEEPEVKSDKVATTTTYWCKK